MQAGTEWTGWKGFGTISRTCVGQGFGIWVSFSALSGSIVFASVFYVPVVCLMCFCKSINLHSYSTCYSACVLCGCLGFLPHLKAANSSSCCSCFYSSFPERQEYLGVDTIVFSFQLLMVQKCCTTWNHTRLRAAGGAEDATSSTHSSAVIHRHQSIHRIRRVIRCVSR